GLAGGEGPLAGGGGAAPLGEIRLAALSARQLPLERRHALLERPDAVLARPEPVRERPDLRAGLLAEALRLGLALRHVETEALPVGARGLGRLDRGIPFAPRPVTLPPPLPEAGRPPRPASPQRPGA